MTPQAYQMPTIKARHTTLRKNKELSICMRRHERMIYHSPNAWDTAWSGTLPELSRRQWHDAADRLVAYAVHHARLSLLPCIRWILTRLEFACLTTRVKDDDLTAHLLCRIFTNRDDSLVVRKFTISCQPIETNHALGKAGEPVAWTFSNGGEQWIAIVTFHALTIFTFRFWGDTDGTDDHATISIYHGRIKAEPHAIHCSYMTPSTGVWTLNASGNLIAAPCLHSLACVPATTHVWSASFTEYESLQGYTLQRHPNSSQVFAIDLTIIFNKLLKQCSAPIDHRASGSSPVVQEELERQVGLLCCQLILMIVWSAPAPSCCPSLAYQNLDYGSLIVWWSVENRSWWLSLHMLDRILKSVFTYPNKGSTIGFVGGLHADRTACLELEKATSYYASFWCFETWRLNCSNCLSCELWIFNPICIWHENGKV